MVSVKKKLLKAVGIVLLLLMLLSTIALIVLAVFSYKSNTPPKIFGYRLFTVKESQLDIIGENYALLVSDSDIEYLSAGNAILYLPDGEDTLNLARVEAVEQDNSIKISDDIGYEGIISSSQYYYKIDYHMKEVGYIITFLMSPFGAVIIALVPCVIIVLVEFIKLLRRKTDAPEVIPILKEEIDEDDIEDVLRTPVLKKPVRERSASSKKIEVNSPLAKKRYTVKKASEELFAKKAIQSAETAELNKYEKEKVFFDENPTIKIKKEPVKSVDEFDVESILADLDRRDSK